MLDQKWIEVVDHLKVIKKAGRVCGPREMSSLISKNFFEYSTKLHDFQPTDVLLVHKGLSDQIESDYFALALLLGRVSFANEVFIVLVGADVISSTAKFDTVKHLRGFGNKLRGANSNQGIQTQGRPAACYLGNGIVLASLIDGQKIFLDGDDISLTPHLAFDGYWESWITAAFLGRLRLGMNVLDIGANCGYYSLLAAKAVGERGSVIAIDANPKMCALVEKSLSVNGHMGYSKVLNAAVMEKLGTVKFAIPKKFKGSATYVRDDLDFSSFNETYDVIEVPADSLANLVGEKKFDVVKIDAEGAEPLIYKGARDFFLATPGIEIFMEFAPSFFSDIISGVDFLDLIEKDGFEVSIVAHDGTIQASTRDQILSGAYADIFLKLK